CGGCIESSRVLARSTCVVRGKRHTLRSSATELADEAARAAGGLRAVAGRCAATTAAPGHTLATAARVAVPAVTVGTARPRDAHAGVRRIRTVVTARRGADPVVARTRVDRTARQNGRDTDDCHAEQGTLHDLTLSLMLPCSRADARTVATRF